MTYPNSLTVLEKSLSKAPDTPVTLMAQKIIEGCKAMDLQTSKELDVHKDYKKNGQLIKRNLQNPVEFNHDSVVGAPGATWAAVPLLEGEKWNEDRRRSNTGLKYDFNAQGLPQNPFLNTGLLGQGLLWHYGPNHAVDNGILVTRKDEKDLETLYAVGIHRMDGPGKPALSGGFLTSKQIEGRYVLNLEAAIDSRVQEFFEELISGSITLLPEYQNRLDPEYAQEVAQRMTKRSRPLEQSKLDEIYEQTITRLKMEQVEALDSDFFVRLRQVVAKGEECFAGPVLNSARATNNAWIETRLSWVHLTDEKWQFVKGDNPPFDYQFSSGDDAQSVHYFEIGADLIRESNNSHAPLFGFMAASYLLHAQENGQHIPDNIMAQMQDMMTYLDKFQTAHLSADLGKAPNVLRQG